MSDSTSPPNSGSKYRRSRWSYPSRVRGLRRRSRSHVAAYASNVRDSAALRRLDAGGDQVPDETRARSNASQPSASALVWKVCGALCRPRSGPE